MLQKQVLSLRVSKRGILLAGSKCYCCGIILCVEVVSIPTEFLIFDLKK